MKLCALLISATLLCSAAVAEPAALPERIAKILSRGDGKSQQTAYKVKSVHEEYQVVAALALQAGGQSLVVNKKPYDLIEGTDPQTGAKRDVWFDISAFYPEF
jgi:hypothetical protein